MANLAKRVTFVSVLLLATAMVAFSRPPAGSMDAPKSGFRAEILMDLGQLEQKYVDLAGAVPAEKYSWRPGDGVRSVGEVYAHIIGANYMFMGMLGAKPPMKMNPDLEKTSTGKEDVSKMLKPSFDFVRTTVIGLSDNDLEKTTQMFGNTVTYRMVLLAEMGHLHEHLGQSIAYARTNNVVPPWTAAEQAAMKKNAK